MARTGMGNYHPYQYSLLDLSNSNSPTPMPHSDQRHILIAERLRDVIFSAKYVNTGSDTDNQSLPFTAEKIKSEIERRLHQFLPSFHTPTHLPYASMIQRAIVELGEGQGLSEESISDFIKKEYEDLPWAHSALLSRHLGKLCESGELVKSKCGWFYKFKTEDGGVKRKKRRGKTSGRNRQRGVQCTDEVENEEFDGKKESQNQVIVGLPSQEELTIKGTKELSASLRREIEGAGVGDPSQGGQMVVLDNFKEVKEDNIIDECLKEEVKSRDGIENFDGKKKSLSRTNTLRLCANEARTIQETTVHGRQIEVLDKLEMAGENKMVVAYREEEGQGEVVEEPMEGSNGEEGHSEETTSLFFDTHSNLGDEEENESIDALCFKKLQEDNKHVELFDSISDHDDDEVIEMIDAQSSKENVRCKVSDEQNKLQEELQYKVNDDRSQLDKTEDPQLSKEQPQQIGPSETNMTSETRVAGSLPLEHQIETPKHAEQGKTCTPGSGKNANAKLLDIISSSKVQPSERRGRGRPRKLNIHGILKVPSSSSPQDCNHQYLEMNSKVNEASKVETGDGTHYLDQQQHQKLPKGGRGRGRGRPRTVKQDQISMSETVSPPKDSDHQQSLDRRDSGMPLKRKFDADLSLRDVLMSKNEQQEPKRRGRGRPHKVL